MRRITGLLRRHGLTLVLTGALVSLYFNDTVPALRERAQLRARRAGAEAQLTHQRQQLDEGLLWLRGSEDDPFVRERFQDAHTWSPDIPGPRVRFDTPDEQAAGGNGGSVDGDAATDAATGGDDAPIR
jgi:hypothetical protein